MESVGTPQRAAQVSKIAPQDSGPEAAGKTPEAGREAKGMSTKELVAVAPQDGHGNGNGGDGDGGGVSQPTPGHGLGQHVDIKV